MKYLKYNFPIILSISICIIALVATATQSTPTNDLYWHLATGRDFLFFGDSPFKDHFTFTHYGETISGNPVVFQVLSASITTLLGIEEGVVVLKLLVFTCSLIAIYFFFRTNNVHIIAALAALPFIVFFLMQRGELARPELLSYIFLIIMLILYFNATREFSTRNLALISIVLVLWGNYHNPIIGYILAFGLFFEKGVHKIEGRESFNWIYFISWAIIIFLTGFINIKFSHFIFSQLNFSNEWKFIIVEFYPLDQYYPLLFRVVFFSSGFFLLIWLFKTHKYGMLVICVLLLTQTWNIARLLSFTGIIISCLYCLFFNEVLNNYFMRHDRKSQSVLITKSITTLIVLISIIGHIILLYAADHKSRTTYIKEAYFPQSIVKYMEQTYSAGNIFNLYAIGGYLAYSFHHDFKTYIDGRSNILFSLEFMKNYLLGLTSPSILKREVDKYGINFAILKHKPSRYELVANTGVFSIDYSDQYFFLATTGTAKFPLSGDILMQPACWDIEFTSKLLKEIDTGSQILPVKSPLRELQRQLKNYTQANNKSKFLDHQINTEPVYDSTKRALAYLALREGFDKKAVFIFSSINNKISTDIMAMAIAMIKLEEHQNAYNHLEMNFLPIDKLDKLHDSEKQTILEIFKPLSEIEVVASDDQLSLELENVSLADNNTLLNNLCNTRTLQKHRILSILENAKSLEGK